MKRRTQTSDILHYLKTHKSGITSMQAFELFGTTRLSGLIYMLRKYGYNIVTENVLVKTRYGNHVEIARYKLEA